MQRTLQTIQRELQGNIGQRVELVCNNRRKIMRHRGVLTATYPAVFTVVVQTEDESQRLSYTYADVLTGNISVQAL